MFISGIHIHKNERMIISILAILCYQILSIRLLTKKVGAISQVKTLTRLSKLWFFVSVSPIIPQKIQILERSNIFYMIKQKFLILMFWILWVKKKTMCKTIKNDLKTYDFWIFVNISCILEHIMTINIHWGELCLRYTWKYKHS